ncbi:MAG: HTH domain-containing protein, partial [Nanoarchaeota archaeon]
KRFGQHGMQFIPVLEYLQMAGRAGRPKYDTVGEAILIASTEAERDELLDRYIHGEPEDIYSKLAVEPVLRTYILSLISSRVVGTRTQLLDFFSQTFWAHQFKDLAKLSGTIDKMLKLLIDWNFISGPAQDDFVSAHDFGKDAFKATFLGKRVAELYLDPLTAHQMVLALQEASTLKTLKPISFLHALCTTLEMRPLLRVGVREYDLIQSKLVEWDQWLLIREPSAFDPEYEEFLDAVKTTMMFADWIDECDEEFLLEKYKVRPGELSAKLDNADWLLYSMTELTNILNLNELVKELARVRLRLKYGAKEELLPLLKLSGIGKVRARKMFIAGLKDIGDVRKVTIEKLTDVLGKAVALSVKKQVGTND